MKSMAGRLFVVSTVVAAATAGALTGGVPAGAAKIAKPAIALSSVPATITALDGEASVVATVVHATTCSLSVTPRALESYPATDCSAGSYSVAVGFPYNSSTKKSVTYKMTLTATGPGGSKTKTAKLKVAPGSGGTAAVAPTISTGERHLPHWPGQFVHHLDFSLAHGNGD